MSDQRRYRQELKQGLHQFVMTMYQSYLETNSVDQAKVLVNEAIKEQQRLFMADDPTFGESAKEVITRQIQDLKLILDKAQTYDTQMQLAEKIDTLSDALDILEGRH